jgi:hypothetical protein
MGLDAVVYCDCFEKGRLHGLPPPGCNLLVSLDGSLLCGSDDLEVQLAFDQWQLNRACEHELGVMLHHHIGNIALVAALRNELGRQAEQFPLLLSKVLYNGTHCGDHLTVEEVKQMRSEVQALRGLPCSDTEMAGFVGEFAVHMAELVDCALRVGKPLVF